MATSQENIEKRIANPNASDQTNFDALEKQFLQFLDAYTALESFVGTCKEEENFLGAMHYASMFIGRYFYRSSGIEQDKDMYSHNIAIIAPLFAPNGVWEQTITKKYTSLDWAVAGKLFSIDGFSSTITLSANEKSSSAKSLSLSGDNELVKRIEADDIAYVKNHRKLHQGPSFEDARVQIYFLARYLYDFAKRKSNDVTLPKRARTLQLALFANPSANPHLKKWLENQEIPPAVMTVIEPFLKDPAYTPHILLKDIMADDCAAPLETKKEVEPPLPCRPPIITLEQSEFLMPGLQRSPQFLQMLLRADPNEFKRFVESVVAALSGKPIDETWHIPMTAKDAKGWLQASLFSDPHEWYWYYNSFMEIAGPDFKKWCWEQNIRYDLPKKESSTVSQAAQDTPSAHTGRKLLAIEMAEDPSLSSASTLRLVQTASAGFWGRARTQVMSLGTTALLAGSTVTPSENTKVGAAASASFMQNNPMEENPQLYFALVTMTALAIVALAVSIYYASTKESASTSKNNEEAPRGESPRPR